MKIKILALIAAILCISMLFVACDTTEETTETEEITTEETTVEETTTEEITTAPCETHVDEDANKSCDVCGIAIVYMPELVAPETETRVPMEIVDIPEDVTAEDYINVEYDEIVYGELEELAGEYFTAGDDVTVYYYEATELKSAYYEVVNDYTREVVLTVPVIDDVEISFDFNYFYFCVVRTGVEIASFENYTYTGKLIGEAYQWDALVNTEDRYTFKVDTVELDYYHSDISVNYLIDSEGTVYAFDAVTGEIIHSESEDTIVFRPEFDTVCGDFGYQIDHDTATLYVYDLTKWIDCIMTYTIPSSYDYEIFMLENGNVLIQSIDLVDRYAVSYDIVYYGDKCNIDYTIIDPAAKQVKAVEFGYYVVNVDNAISGLTENAENVLAIHPIRNDRIDFNRTVYVVVDNELNVKMDVTDYVESNAVLVADGVFVGQIRYNNSTAYVLCIMTADGTVVRTLPNNVFIGDTYIEINNKFYDFDMNLLIDCDAEDGYSLYIQQRSYLIFTKTVELEDGSAETEYYFFNPEVNEEPVKIELDFISFHSSFVFGICYSVENEDVVTYVYEIRNAHNELIHTGEERLNDLTYVGDDIVFEFTSGEKFISKPE